MKKKLFELYTSKNEEFKTVKTLIKNAKVNGPFLMSPSEKFAIQPVKLLVIGQETNGWENHTDLQQQMNVYEGFNLGINYYSSPFWNVIRKLEKGLKNSKYSCAWTNISKFDIDNKRPLGEHEKIINKMDYLLLDEITILNPDFCMFFTGHVFDYRLKKVFPDIKFLEIADFGKLVLCRLSHEKLPFHSYRTYHPNYLRRSKIEHSFFEFINKTQADIAASVQNIEN